MGRSRILATPTPKASRCRTRLRRRACSSTCVSCQTDPMSYPPIRWGAIVPGDSVRLRPKRTSGERIETTVAQLLDRSLADGLGFVNEAGEIFQQYFYDVEITTPPTP